jgi:hypothetical protein
MRQYRSTIATCCSILDNRRMLTCRRTDHLRGIWPAAHLYSVRVCSCASPSGAGRRDQHQGLANNKFGAAATVPPNGLSRKAGFLVTTSMDRTAVVGIRSQLTVSPKASLIRTRSGRPQGPAACLPRRRHEDGANSVITKSPPRMRPDCWKVRCCNAFAARAQPAGGPAAPSIAWVRTNGGQRP